MSPPLRAALPLLRVRYGAGVSCAVNLIRALARRSDVVPVVIGQAPTRLFAALPSRVVHVAAVKNTAGLGRLVYEQLVLPRVLRRLGVDVIYSGGNIGVLGASCASVVLVENSNPFSRLPLQWGWKQRLRFAVLRTAARASVSNARAVVFPSDKARALLAPRLCVPALRSFVVHHGWDPCLVNAVKGTRWPGLPDRSILVVGDLHPHKAVETAMQAFSLAVTRDAYNGGLVIAGAPLNAAYVRRLDQLRQNLPAGDRIMFIGAVDYPEILALYAQADALVAPSVEETFGLPLLEAMGCGTPVVAAAEIRGMNGENLFLPAREICGDAAGYFAPFDGEGAWRELRQILLDPALAISRREAGLSRATQFTWDRTAAQLVTIFSQAVRREKMTRANGSLQARLEEQAGRGAAER